MTETTDFEPEDFDVIEDEVWDFAVVDEDIVDLLWPADAVGATASVDIVAVDVAAAAMRETCPPLPQLTSEALSTRAVGSGGAAATAIDDGFLVNLAFSPSSPSWMVRAERRLEVSENSLEHPPETAGVPSVQKDRVESSPGTSFSV